MKKILVSFLLLAFCNVYTPVLAAVNVQSGTEIQVSPTAKVSSSDGAANIPVEVNEDVVVNGVTVFKEGAKGIINITDSEEAGFFGNSGEMLLLNGYIYDAKGTKRKISFAKKIKAKDKTWVKVTTCCGILLWPLLLFGFVKGKNASVTPGKIFDVTTNETFAF